MKGKDLSCLNKLLLEIKWVFRQQCKILFYDTHFHQCKEQFDSGGKKLLSDSSSKGNMTALSQGLERRVKAKVVVEDAY